MDALETVGCSSGDRAELRRTACVACCLLAHVGEPVLANLERSRCDSAVMQDVPCKKE